MFQSRDTLYLNYDINPLLPVSGNIAKVTAFFRFALLVTYVVKPFLLLCWAKFVEIFFHACIVLLYTVRVHVLCTVVLEKLMIFLEKLLFSDGINSYKSQVLLKKWLGLEFVM